MVLIFAIVIIIVILWYIQIHAQDLIFYIIIIVITFVSLALGVYTKSYRPVEVLTHGQGNL